MHTEQQCHPSADDRSLSLLPEARHEATQHHETQPRRNSSAVPGHESLTASVDEPIRCRQTTTLEREKHN